VANSAVESLILTQELKT